MIARLSESLTLAGVVLHHNQQLDNLELLAEGPNVKARDGQNIERLAGRRPGKYTEPKSYKNGGVW